MFLKQEGSFTEVSKVLDWISSFSYHPLTSERRIDSNETRTIGTCQNYWKCLNRRASIDNTTTALTIRYLLSLCEENLIIAFFLLFGEHNETMNKYSYVWYVHTRMYIHIIIIYVWYVHTRMYIHIIIIYICTECMYICINVYIVYKFICL